MKNKTILSCLVLFSWGKSNAQLTITDSLDQATMTNLLQGFGTNITNLVFNCDPRSMAQFNGVSEVPITNGLLLSTGIADSAATPNNSDAYSTMIHYSPPPQDSDLLLLVSANQYDQCIIEFDCIPLGDTLLFNYAFGSEEYPEYVNSVFNDVFGVFLTGSGGFNHTNIALIPGTNIPVSINTVNATASPTFYTDNTGGHFCQYDGITTNLTSITPVSPYSVYHFKIAIADVGDGIYDSGVFLQAYSFKSNPQIGIKEQDARKEFFLFADLASGNLTLRFTNPSVRGQTLEVFDLSGKKIFGFALSEGVLTQQFSLNNAENGVYFARIISADKQLFSTKFILEK